MRILLLRGGALGDFVVTLPAIELLRARWPEARIELVGNPSAAALGLRSATARNGTAFAPCLDAVHAQGDARWSRLGAGAMNFGKRDETGRNADEFAAWLASFDLAINFWPDADGAIAADFARLGFVSSPADPAWHDARAKRFLSASATPQRAPAPAHFCAALASLGLATDDFRARLFPNAEDDALAETMLSSSPGAGGSGYRCETHSRTACAVAGPDEAGPNAATFPRHSRFIALHPGAGSPKKIWPLERWLAVIDALRAEKSFRIVVLLGEVERANERRLRDLERNLPPDALVLCSPAPPLLAAVLRRCALFLGHDSGPAHVAAAVGTPCVLVFGPTDPAMWAPPGEHVRALRRGEATSDVRTDDVLRAAASILAASPDSQIQTTSPFSAP